MSRNIKGYLAVYLSMFLGLAPGLGFGCTTLSIPQSTEKLVAKSYAWHQHHGYSLINLRNLKKQALLLDTVNTPATWTSKYGSLTFNQHGREMPLGGTNEKGLTVEIMWLDSSIYPGPDKTPAINELQWIQYQLDSAATVAEAVQLARGVRIVPAVAKVHYLICDTTGACATFEYVDEKLTIHDGAKAPISALTNDSYDDSLGFLSQHVGFGGTSPLPGGDGSLARFVRAASYGRAFDPAKVADPVAYAFDALAKVEQHAATPTTWNIVYEPVSWRAHFRTKGMPEIKSIDATKFDYSCKQKPQFVDMKARTTGDVTGDFRPLETANNLDLVRMGLAPFASQLPAHTVELAAQYPLTLQCTE